MKNIIFVFCCLFLLSACNKKEQPKQKTTGCDHLETTVCYEVGVNISLGNYDGYEVISKSRQIKCPEKIEYILPTNKK